MKDHDLRGPVSADGIIARLRQSGFITLPHGLRVIPGQADAADQSMNETRCVIVTPEKDDIVRIDIPASGFSKDELLELHHCCRATTGTSLAAQGCTETPIPMSCTMIIEDNEVEQLTFRFRMAQG